MNFYEKLTHPSRGALIDLSLSSLAVSKSCLRMHFFASDSLEILRGASGFSRNGDFSMSGVGKGSKPSPLPSSSSLPPRHGNGEGERGGGEGEEIGRSEIACKFIAERILDSKEGGKEENGGEKERV